MARQYKRSYELTIIPPDEPAIIVRGLRCNFEITKSLISLPNLAKISLYNLNDDTLAALQTKFTEIIFNAGYEGNVRLLFRGQIRNTFLSRENPNKIATIYAGDGQRDWQESTFNKTFNENVSIQTAVKEVLSSFKNLSVGIVSGLTGTPDKLRGQTLSGKSADIMDNLARDYGFDWSIQDNELTIVPDEEVVPGVEATLINAATGMIGSPALIETNVGIGGVEVTTLLNPNIRPNNLIRIESIATEIAIGNLFFREIKKTQGEGVYKVQEITFLGDSREGEWVSKIKGRTING
jgi:hypothetical protein